MSGPIVRLCAEHFDAAMEFLNRAFGEREPMDFARMLPSIYQRDDASMQNNYAIFENGDISAIVGLFPLRLMVGDVLLRVAGIGGVSAAPEKRGQGLMSRLMSHVRDEVVRHGYDLSYLGGARQRYRRFGWERAGVELAITLGKTARATVSAGGIAFDEAPSDAATVGRMKELHDAQEIHCVREISTFTRTLGCWYHTWWSARDGDRVVGYVVTDKNGAKVPEIVAENDDVLVRMALAWAGRSDKSVVITLPAAPSPALRTLAELAESVDCHKSGNWQVFNWAKVLDAMLRLRRRQTALPPGELVIGVDERQHLHVEVRADSAGCSNRPERVADLTCEPMQLVRAAFGPLAPSLVLAGGPKTALLDAWCPLPLAISEQDHV